MKQLFVSLIIIISLSGCDIFTTREAEQPNQPRSNFIPALTPEDVLTNLKSSLEDLNVENYLACFSDSAFSERQFRFAASSTAISQFPIMAAGWGKMEEQQYFLNMKNKIPEEKQILLTFFDIQIGSTQGDSTIFTGSYSLNVPHNDPGVPVLFEGELSFSMNRDSRSVWTIHFWRDNRSGEMPSWSELKGRFY
jgi:hypothetical protein